MDEYSRFILKEHTFVAYLPSDDDEPCEWTLIVSREGEEVLREAIPLIYTPIFGPDMGDLAQLDVRVEAIIAELHLEDDDPGVC